LVKELPIIQDNLEMSGCHGFDPVRIPHSY
jgi:hypothetical protein